MAGNFFGRLSRYLTDNLVKIFEGTEACGVHRDPQGVWQVSTSSGAIEVARMMISDRVWSKRLLADLGVKLLLEEEKAWKKKRIQRDLERPRHAAATSSQAG